MSKVTDMSRVSSLVSSTVVWPIDSRYKLFTRSLILSIEIGQLWVAAESKRLNLHLTLNTAEQDVVLVEESTRVET